MLDLDAKKTLNRINILLYRKYQLDHGRYFQNHVFVVDS